MKILIINNSGFITFKDDYYITKTTGQFIKDFQSKGWGNVCLFQFEEYGNIKEGINDFTLDKSIPIQTVPYSTGVRKAYSYKSALLATWNIIRKNMGFTYIFFPGHIPLIVAYCCILFNKPFGIYVRGEYNSILSRPIFKKAKFINTVGTVFQQDIKRINTNCHIIKPMVQFDFTKDLEKSNAIRRKEILFVGRIEKRKGVWEIVKAAQKIKNTLPDYIFRLIGAGQDMEDIENYIEENGLENVVLHGAIYNPDELKKFYLESEIFLFPSYDEGFPRVLYEAMYFKLPIITTFVGNIPGLMKNEYNALKLESRSVNSIIEQINKLKSTVDLSVFLAENGKSTLSVIFNDKNIEHSELLNRQILDL